MFRIFFILAVFILAAMYFLPSIIAIARKHAHVLQITILNAFLGWMFPVWVAALIWSTTKNTDEFIETKGSWAIIILFMLILVSPIAFGNFIFNNYKPKTTNEFHYKKVIYTTDVDMNSGKVVRKVIEINNEKTGKTKKK